MLIDKSNIKNVYFRWMLQNLKVGNYFQLLNELNSISFTWVNPMDENCVINCNRIRYERFADELNIDPTSMSILMSDMPVSVLEVMYYLAFMAERTLDYHFDQFERWFWPQIDNLGLSDMTDNNFDSDKVQQTINNFLTLNYSPDGTGGLFKTISPRVDMRTLDLWWQMNRYLIENNRGEK